MQMTWKFCCSSVEAEGEGVYRREKDHEEGSSKKVFKRQGPSRGVKGLPEEAGPLKKKGPSTWKCLPEEKGFQEGNEPQQSENRG